MKEMYWIEKEFHLNLTVEAFPSIVERLRGTPARVEERVNFLPAEIVTSRVGDSCAIQEHVGHLYDLDELHEGRLDDFGANLEVLRAADMANKKTYEADHNANSMQTLLALFRAARMHFVKRLEEMDEATIATSAIHPRIKKPMRVINLALFVAEHDDHHLASITGLARTLRG